jgi:hypothetical protein
MDEAQFNKALCLFDRGNNRFFDFAEFAPLGEAFMSAFALGFIRYTASVKLDAAQGAFCATVRFLGWVDSRQKELVQFVSKLKSDYTTVSAKEWEDVVALWRDDLINQPRPGRVTKYNYISNLNTVLKRMAGLGIVPKITLIRAPRKLREASRPTRTLIEVNSQSVKEDTQTILEEALAGAKGTYIDIQVKKDFLATLLNETGEILGSSREHARVLMEINTKRLRMIRECASKDFQKWHDHWIEGQRLLQLCDLSFEEIAEVIAQRASRIWGFRRLFPKSNPQLSLARLLKYFSEHPEYRGRIVGWPEKSLGQWFDRKAMMFGGRDLLQAYLFPHRELTASVITIFLCDTGANVAVAKSLPYDCLANANRAHYKTVTGVKMRAGGKLIVNELPLKDPAKTISTVEAIQIYQDLSRSLRSLSTGKVSDRLFLYLGLSGVVKEVDTQRWAKMFDSFRNRHPELQHLSIQSKMIRPSVLMQVTFDKETGLIAGSAVGDHVALKTTGIYASRFPNQLVWERMIREFQALFQIVAIQSVDGAATKLGLTSEQVAVLLSEAHRTGLGVACLDPRSGIQPGSTKGEPCTQLQNCPTCPYRFVVGTTENLRDLLLWNCHLKRLQPEWEKTRPERWEKIWLPWLVFTEVAIQQASRGRTVEEFKKAKALADEQVTKGNVHFGPLW